MQGSIRGLEGFLGATVTSEMLERSECLRPSSNHTPDVPGGEQGVATVSSCVMAPLLETTFNTTSPDVLCAGQVIVLCGVLACEGGSMSSGAMSARRTSCMGLGSPLALRISPMGHAWVLLLPARVPTLLCDKWAAPARHRGAGAGHLG